MLVVHSRLVGYYFSLCIVSIPDTTGRAFEVMDIDRERNSGQAKETLDVILTPKEGGHPVSTEYVERGGSVIQVCRQL